MPKNSAIVHFSIGFVVQLGAIWFLDFLMWSEQNVNITDCTGTLLSLLHALVSRPGNGLANPDTPLMSKGGGRASP